MSIEIENIDQSEGKSKPSLENEVNPGTRRQCRCPNCGYREMYQISVPCYYKKCPLCGSPMTND